MQIRGDLDRGPGLRELQIDIGAHEADTKDRDGADHRREDAYAVSETHRTVQELVRHDGYDKPADA